MKTELAPFHIDAELELLESFFFKFWQQTKNNPSVQTNAKFSKPILIGLNKCVNLNHFK